MYRKYISLLVVSLGLCHAAYGKAGEIDTYYTKAVAYPDCAPNDAPAVRIVLFHKKVETYPRIEIYTWDNIKKEDGAEEVMLCNRVSRMQPECRPLNKAVVHFDHATDENVHSVWDVKEFKGTLQWLKKNTKIITSFTAPKTPSPNGQVFCGR